MTTNRMGLEQTLSDERLEELITELELCGIYGRQVRALAELQGFRKARKEPVTPFGYVHQCDHFFTNDHGNIYKTPGGNFTRPLYATPQLQTVTVPDEPTDDERLMEIEGVSVVKLPTEFHSEHGVVVQLEKVMAALAVHGIKYERRHQKVVGLRAGIYAVRAEGIDIDAEKINAEKCHK